jgi:ribosomal protein S18 acetylase RimI-like enzyme
LKEPGAGRGRQACAQVLRYVFETLGAHRLSLDVIETNERAARLYDSLGFRREGIMREAFRRGEEYRSLILMSLWTASCAVTIRCVRAPSAMCRLEHEYRALASPPRVDPACAGSE